MRGQHLISREEAFKRAERIKKEYEIIHGIEFQLYTAYIPLDRVIPTQGELSEVKLLVVLQEIKHGYDAPIIVLECRGDYYVIDGHHRAFALRKLGFPEIEAIILKSRKDISLGVVETAKKRKLTSLDDIKIVRG
ncbi:ParB/RepB/Spo0J family partition protein [Thermococcus sp.]